jgi:hypothetical protein
LAEFAFSIRTSLGESLARKRTAFRWAEGEGEIEGFFNTEDTESTEKRRRKTKPVLIAT